MKKCKVERMCLKCETPITEKSVTYFKIPGAGPEIEPGYYHNDCLKEEYRIYNEAIRKHILT